MGLIGVSAVENRDYIQENQQGNGDWSPSPRTKRLRCLAACSQYLQRVRYWKIKFCHKGRSVRIPIAICRNYWLQVCGTLPAIRSRQDAQFFNVSRLPLRESSDGKNAKMLLDSGCFAISLFRSRSPEKLDEIILPDCGLRMSAMATCGIRDRDENESGVRHSRDQFFGNAKLGWINEIIG